MSTPLRIESTADGSQTLFSEEYGLHYHSTHGAIQESEHVFIKEGLLRSVKKELNILEIGLGTGLNALLTLRNAEEDQLKVNYEGLELNPVPEEIWSQILYCEQMERPELSPSFSAIHLAPWNDWIPISDFFQLKKTLQDFREADFGSNQDLVYFDAFGPGSQPELWTIEIFNRLYASMAHEGILTTYSAKGDVRRALISAGFKVEKRPGPPGKREMLVAIK